jgi:hypothetical protein
MEAATEIDSLATIIAAADGAGRPGGAFPSLDDALARLADIPAEGNLAVTRRVALENLLRAQPDLAAEGARRDLAGRALAAGGLLVADPVRVLLEDSARVPPTGRLTRVVTGEGNVDAVAVVGTSLAVPARFDEAKRVLNPVNWLECYGKWWTGMTFQPPGQVPGQDRRHYRELVADWSPSLKVDVCLQFVRSNEPGDIATLEFERCQIEEHQPSDCRVVVDEGWVEVKRVGDEVLITTSKRIQFADPFNDGPFLSVSAAGLGYRDLAEELAVACINCGDGADTWEPEEVGDGR